MSKTDLQTILRMRKPTGRHVGAAMLLNLVNDYKKAGTPHEPLFSQEKLLKMVDSLSSDIELRVYANYADIVTGAEHLFDYIECCVQQVMHGFYRLNTVMSELSVRYKLRVAAADSILEKSQLDALSAMLDFPSNTFDDPDNIKFLELSYNSLIIPGIRSMLAFDAFTDVIAEVTEVSELTEIKSQSAYILETISFLNNITQGESLTSEKNLLEGLFPPIDFERQYPRANKISELKNILSPINHERCLPLKKLKPLMLSLRAEGESP